MSKRTRTYAWKCLRHYHFPRYQCHHHRHNHRHSQRYHHYHRHRRRRRRRSRHHHQNHHHHHHRRRRHHHHHHHRRRRHHHHHRRRRWWKSNNSKGDKLAAYINSEASISGLRKVEEWKYFLINKSILWLMSHSIDFQVDVSIWLVLTSPPRILIGQQIIFKSWKGRRWKVLVLLWTR